MALSNDSVRYPPVATFDLLSEQTVEGVDVVDCGGPGYLLSESEGIGGWCARREDAVRSGDGDAAIDGEGLSGYVPGVSEASQKRVAASSAASPLRPSTIRDAGLSRQPS